MKKAVSHQSSVVSLFLAIVVLVAACARGEAAGPPEINYGRDVCDHCGMIITEPRHASAYRLASGEVKKFDDVGDMVLRATTNRVLDSASIWVHDYESEVWLGAESAWYVAGTGVITPMAHGIVAFALETSARTFARQTGAELFTWSEINQMPIANGLVGDHHMVGDDMHDE